MLRQLPPTITADKSPDWLPAGWIAQSTVLQRGRVTRSYTHLETGEKFATKDDVLQYIAMVKARESRYSETERAKHGVEMKKNPWWLPDNWTLEVKNGSGGNAYKVYTNVLTGFKCYNMRSVQRFLWYAGNKSDEQKQLMLTTNEQPEWLPENWIVKEKITTSGAKQKIYIDQLSGCKCYSKVNVIRYLDTLKLEASTKQAEETGTTEDTSLESEEHEGSLESEEKSNASSSSIEDVTYKHRGRLPAYPKMKMRTRKRGLTKSPSPPATRRKLRSRAVRRQLFEGVDTSSSGDDAVSESEASTDEIHDETDYSEAELIVSHLADCLAEEDLHDVVVEFDDQAKETSGLTGSSGAEVNVECQCALPERDLNESGTEEIDVTNIGLGSTGQNNGKDGFLMSGSGSAKDEITQESGCKSTEPLKVQALREEERGPEEITNESCELLFFPFKDAPTDADHVTAFDTSTAALSAEDHGNTFELASKSCAEWEKNICSSKMQKKSIGASLSKQIKEIDPRIPCTPIKQPEKPKTPAKLQGERSERAASEKASMSTAVDQNEPPGPYGSVSEAYWPHDFAYKNPSRTGTSAGEGSSRNSRTARQRMDHWPDLCPEFVFESLTSSSRKEDDSVIRRYLEERVTAAGTAAVNLPLPDFGLPSFAHVANSHLSD